MSDSPWEKNELLLTPFQFNKKTQFICVICKTIKLKEDHKIDQSCCEYCLKSIEKVKLLPNFDCYQCPLVDKSEEKK